MAQIEKFQTRVAYWGGCDYFRGSTGLALKQIYMRAGSQSSMEYHVHKRELYWVSFGTLKLGLRDGRGVNRSIILNEGDCYEIEPGQMHMRIALTHIVFDGKIYHFTEGEDDAPVSR